MGLRFKALTIGYNSINGTATEYLCELVISFKYNARYRTNDSKHLSSERTINLYGGRCFGEMAANLWRVILQ